VIGGRAVTNQMQNASYPLGPQPSRERVDLPRVTFGRPGLTVVLAFLAAARFRTTHDLERRPAFHHVGATSTFCAKRRRHTEHPDMCPSGARQRIARGRLRARSF